MVIHHNMLRFYRKQSRLTQLDIAFILGLENNSNISRWEKGERAPALQTLLVYQLLFDIPIESLFERQKHEVIPMLQERLTRRIQDLKGNENESDATERIGCLESILIRLNHIATL